MPPNANILAGRIIMVNKNPNYDSKIYKARFILQSHKDKKMNLLVMHLNPCQFVMYAYCSIFCHPQLRNMEPGYQASITPRTKLFKSCFRQTNSIIKHPSGPFPRNTLTSLRPFLIKSNKVSKISPITNQKATNEAKRWVSVIPLPQPSHIKGSTVSKRCTKLSHQG